MIGRYYYAAWAVFLLNTALVAWVFPELLSSPLYVLSYALGAFSVFAFFMSHPWRHDWWRRE